MADTLYELKASIDVDIRGFADELRKAIDALKKMTADVRTASTGLDAMETDSKGAAGATDKLGNELKQTGAEAVKMSKVSFAGFAAGLAKARDVARDAAQQIGAGARRIAVAAGAAGAAITGGLAGAGYAAAQFQKDFAEVQTLLSKDIPQTQIDSMKAGLKGLTAEAVTLGDSTKAMYQAISAGVAPAEVIGFLEQNAQAAAAGVTDLTTAVDLSTNILNAYGLSADRTDDVLDSVFVAVKEGKTTFDEMAASVGQVAPLAAAAGVSFEDLNAAIATITKSGLATTSAATGMKAALSNILRPGEAVQKMVLAMGLDFNAASLRTKGFAGFMNDLTKQIEASGEDSTETMVTLFGSIEGANAMMALGANQGKTFTATLDAMGNRAGATAQAFEVIKDNDPTFVFRQLRASLGAVAVTIGENVLKAIAPLVDMFARAVAGVSEWLAKNPVLANGLTLAAAAAGALLLGIAAIAGAVALLMPLIAALLSIGLPALAIMAILMLPLVPIFAALAAGAAYLIANWRQLSDWIKANSETLKSLARDALTPIVESAKRVGAELLGLVKGSGNGLVSWLTANLPNIRKAVLSVSDFIANRAIPLVGNVIAWLLGKFRALIEFVRLSWPQVKSTIVTTFDAIAGAGGLVWDIVKQIVAAFSDLDPKKQTGPADFAATFVQLLDTSTAFLKMLTRIIAKIDAFVNSKSFKVFSKVLFFGPATIFRAAIGETTDAPGDSIDTRTTPIVTTESLGEGLSDTLLGLMGNAPAPALAGGAGGGGAGSGGIGTVNIYQQPGESSDVLLGRLGDLMRLRQGGLG